ncbi:MAG: hypothetical protein O7B23_10775 [Deltaproteobacteria bacterium]|nr:hypothetical protein [Deltaproteobacteria bacterium]
MPTQDQFVDLPLHIGVNLKRDEFTAEAPQLRQQDNTDFDNEIGQVVPLPDHHDITAPTLDAGEQATALVSGNDAVAMITTTGKPKILNKANQVWQDDLVSTYQCNYDLRGEFIVSGRSGVTLLSSCHSGELTAPRASLFAWIEEADPDNIRFLVRSGNSNIGPFTLPKDDPDDEFLEFVCVSTPTKTYLYVLFETGSGSATILAFDILADGTANRGHVTAGLGNNHSKMDVVADPNNPETSHYIVLSNSVNVRRYNPATSDPTTSIPIGTGGTIQPWTDVSIDTDGTDVWVASIDNDLSPERLLVQDFDIATETVTTREETVFPGASTTTRVTIRVASDFVGGCVATLHENNQATSDAEDIRPFTVSSGGTLTWHRRVRNMALVGDAFVDEFGNLLLPLAFTSSRNVNTLGNRFPIDPAIVAYMLKEESFNSDDYSLHPVARWGVDRVRTGFANSHDSMPYAADPTIIAQKFGRNILDVVLSHREWSQEAVLGRGASAFTAGMVSVFDGSRFMPAAFLWRPINSGVFEQAGGTSAAGVYNYKCVLVWETDTGTLIRSADSPEGTPKNLIANQRVQPTFEVSEPPHGVTLIRGWCYGTLVDGVDYYLMEDAVTGGPLEGVYDPSGNFMNFGFVDDASPPIDADGNPLSPLLTFAGIPPELAPESPAAAIDAEVVGQRVWVLEAEDREVIWPSKNLTPGIAPEFNALLKLRLPEEDGAGVALGTVNSFLVAFKKNTTWVLQDLRGPGSVIGTGGPFPKFTKVARVGCADARSVVNFPGGVIFHTGRRLMILGGGLNVAPFGQEIQPLVQDALVSAYHIAPRNEIHFNITQKTGGENRHFVFSYDINLWHEWTDYTYLDAINTRDSELFLTSIAGDVIQLPLQTGGDLLGSLRVKPTRTLTTPFIRPAGSRSAARKVREVIVEMAMPPSTLEGDKVTITLTSAHLDADTAREWQFFEIDAFRTSETKRFFLRVLPEREMESLQVKVEVVDPGGLGLNPINCSVLFGVEEGVDRILYPEGSTK